MKIFLTGGSGLLGRAFVKLLKAQAADFVAPSSTELNLLNFPAVDSFIQTKKPDLIIHCAAYTDVDRAETERDKCWALNVEVLENLLKYEIPIIHFSSDYVFDALVLKDGKPFVIPPDYPRAPLNYYGESKVAAEELLEATQGDWWNVRTTWLYGENGEGFPTKIKAKAASQTKLQVINDQFGRKTLNTDLAAFVLDRLIPGSALEPGITVLGRRNTHYQSPGPIHTWYDWAVEILRDWDGVLIPVSVTSLDLPAIRPKNSVLI